MSLPKKRERTNTKKDGYGTLTDQRSFVSTDDVVTQQDGDMGNRSPTHITIHARETHVGEGGSGFGEQDRRCPGPVLGHHVARRRVGKSTSVPFLEHRAPPAHGALRNAEWEVWQTAHCCRAWAVIGLSKPRFRVTAWRGWEDPRTRQEEKSTRVKNKK